MYKFVTSKIMVPINPTANEPARRLDQVKESSNRFVKGTYTI